MEYKDDEAQESAAAASTARLAECGCWDSVGAAEFRRIFYFETGSRSDLRKKAGHARRPI